MSRVVKRNGFLLFEDGEGLISDVLELIAKLRQDFGIYASHIDLQLVRLVDFGSERNLLVIVEPLVVADLISLFGVELRVIEFVHV